MVQSKVRLTFANERQFEVDTGSGHHFLIDDAIGKTGAKPIELVAAALAGCTAFDVITILRNKKRKTITAYEVSVEADQQPAPPQVFTKVRVHHLITGKDVDAQSVEDAIHLSESKYCSVGAMLRLSGAELSTTYSIQSAETEEERELATVS